MTQIQLDELAAAKTQIEKYTKLQEMIHNNVRKHFGIKRDSQLDDALFDYLYNGVEVNILKKRFNEAVS